VSPIIERHRIVIELNLPEVVSWYGTAKEADFEDDTHLPNETSRAHLQVRQNLARGKLVFL
jgi:hypothetical protein